MKKCFRYMCRLARPYYAAVLISFIVPLVFGMATGFPLGERKLYVFLVNLLPIIVLYLPAIFSITLCSTDLNRALSFGARREDYFLGFLCFTGMNVLLLWGVVELYYRLPGLLGLGKPFGQIGLPSPAFPILLLCVYCAVSAVGIFWLQSQTVGVLLWGGLCGFFSLANPAYKVVEENGVFVLRCIVSGPMILVCVFLTVLSLTWIYNVIKTATVR